MPNPGSGLDQPWSCLALLLVVVLRVFGRSLPVQSTRVESTRYANAKRVQLKALKIY
jgi:hypothetical protein